MIHTLFILILGWNRNCPKTEISVNASRLGIVEKFRMLCPFLRRGVPRYTTKKDLFLKCLNDKEACVRFTVHNRKYFNQISQEASTITESFHCKHLRLYLDHKSKNGRSIFKCNGKRSALHLIFTPKRAINPSLATTMRSGNWSAQKPHHTAGYLAKPLMNNQWLDISPILNETFHVLRHVSCIERRVGILRGRQIRQFDFFLDVSKPRPTTRALISSVTCFVCAK